MYISYIERQKFVLVSCIVAVARRHVTDSQAAIQVLKGKNRVTDKINLSLFALYLRLRLVELTDSNNLFENEIGCV